MAEQKQEDVPAQEIEMREAVDGMRMIVPTVQFTASIIIIMMAGCVAAIMLALDPQHKIDPYFLGLAVLVFGVVCVLIVFMQNVRWPPLKKKK